MGRGPYEPSRDKFVDCICNDLEQGEDYTINEASQKCNVAYRTVHDYSTFNISEVNKKVNRTCGRFINTENVERTLKFPGFRIERSLGGAFSASGDTCTIELPDEPRNSARVTRYSPP